MKKIFITLLFINSAMTLANEDFCMDQANQYGNGSGFDTISQACLEYDSKQATNQSKDANENIRVFAHSNRIYIENLSNGKIDFIAGIYTNLKNTIAVQIMKDRNEIAVLQQSGDILIFSSIITGNVAPYRTISKKELHGSIDLTYLNSKIIVLNNDSKNIFFYDNMANTNGREGYKKDDFLSSQSILDKNLVEIKSANNELTGLSKEGIKVKLN